MGKAQSLHEFFSDAAAAARPAYPSPLRNGPARQRLYREIRAAVPDIQVGAEYWISGLGHPLAWFGALPERPQEEWTQIRVRGRFRSVWGDDRGPYLVFTATVSGFETYFRVSVMRLIAGTVSLERALVRG